jgi:hypothetical protein
MISHFSEAQSAPGGRHVVGAQARDPLPRPAVRVRASARLYGGAGFLSVAAFSCRR